MYPSRDYWREGYDAYNDCENASEKSEAHPPDDVQPGHREEWCEGWLDAAAEDPDNDEVSLADQAIDFESVHHQVD